VNVLLDTSVVISAILFGGVPRTILDRGIRGEIDLVTSPALIDELQELLTVKFGFPAEAGRRVRAEFELLAQVVRPDAVPRIVRDPDDDAVLAAAKTGGCEFIVTGDRDLLDLGTYGAILIVEPRAFLTLMESM